MNLHFLKVGPGPKFQACAGHYKSALSKVFVIVFFIQITRQEGRNQWNPTYYCIIVYFRYALVDQGFLWFTTALLFRDTRCHSTGGSAGFLLVVWFSLHTNLQTALDKVEGHHCCVCEAAAQDTPKATQGIILWGAKLAADILCGRRD